jgi:hypothetical protein
MRVSRPQILRAIVAGLALLGVCVMLAVVRPPSAGATTPLWQQHHYRKIGYVRSFKLDLTEQLPAPPQVVIIGGSRATRFEPNLILQLTGLTAMNCAVSNCRPEDAWAFTNYLLARAPQVKLHCFWCLQVNALADTTFAPGLVYDKRLSQFFPPSLVAQQAQLLGTVRIKDLLRANRFTARGRLVWCPYDKARAEGETLNESLDHWIAVHVPTQPVTEPLPQTRARSYLEATLALYNKQGVVPCLVIMPFQPRALAALRAVEGWQDRFDEFKAYLQGLQTTYQFHLLDYTDISSFGGHPKDFYDGAHITLANARLLLRKAIKAAPECFH